MATRAEQFRADEQRERSKAHRKSTPKEEPARKQVRRTRVERKATYAWEEVAPGHRPSRKTSRKSANRQMTNSSLVRQSKRVRVESPGARPSAARG